MTNQNNVNKRPRDFSKEWTKRLERNKRLVADLDRVKVERLQDKLTKDGQTYAKWLNDRVDLYLDDVQWQTEQIKEYEALIKERAKTL